MATEPPCSSTTATTVPQEKRYRSVFDLPPNFFDSCRLLSPFATSVSDNDSRSAAETLKVIHDYEEEDNRSINGVALTRWTCNTCKTEFESLQDQRSHFKSDVHRFNVIKHLPLMNL